MHRHIPRTLRTLAVALCLAVGSLVAWGSGPLAPAASAQESATVSVAVILASTGDGGVDAALRSRESRLRSQFSRYTQFQLHGQQRLQLTEGRTQTIQVPGGVNASILLVSVRDGNYNLQVQVTGGSTTVRSPRNSLFFVGGPSVQGQTLILMFET
jgi:hypothetical protein